MRDSGYSEITLRDGRTMAYAEHGTSTGHPIIYCHGVPNRIMDWPDDVVDLATALGLTRFGVLGSSGGAAYAAACGARFPKRVRAVGLLGGVAPADAPGVLSSMGGPLRLMFRLARFTPAVLRGLFRLQLRAMRRGGPRASARMAAWAPEPDRVLLQRAEIREGFMGCFEEACRQGTRGPVADVALIARPWGFDLTEVRVPVFLWHGAHLSVPLNHQGEILGAFAAAFEAA